MELGPRKTWSTTQEESSEELDFAKLAEVEKEMNHWKAHYHVLKIKYDDMMQKQAQTEIINSDSLEPIEINNMVQFLCIRFKFISLFLIECSNDLFCHCRLEVFKHLLQSLRRLRPERTK